MNASPFRFRPIHSDGLGAIVRRPTLTIEDGDRALIANAIPEGRRFRVAQIEEIQPKGEPCPT